LSAVLRLVARYGDQVRFFPITTVEASAGSSEDNDIVLPFPGVSRRHASVRRIGRDLLFLDLGSKNGLVVEGKSLPQALLSPGGEILLGRVALRIEEVSASEAELALEIDPGPAAARNLRPSTSSLGLPPLDHSTHAALRFVRDLEQEGGRLEPDSDWMSAARRILGAETLLVFRETGEDVAVVACHGPLPPDGTSGPNVLAGDAGPAEGLRLGAFFPEDRSQPSAWERDFFDYLAQRLGAGGAAEPSPEPRPAEPLLRLPSEMIVGESPAFRALLADLEAAVRSRLDVLLVGETGTGKELLARAVHASGPDAGGPFVAVNCAAIPGDLLEAELFGVQAKVATGVDPRPGLVVQAHGGTMFLDEVAELEEGLQAKLLRVLQEREVRPLGAPKPRPVQVRFVSASNRDLNALVQAGRFRADLYYRLRGFEVRVPPLRDRREDLPGLVSALVARAAADYGKRIAGVSRRALAQLIEHPWPGNVRELQDEIRRAVSRCPDGGVLESRFFTLQESAPLQPSPAESPQPPPRTLEERVNDLEREALRDALAQSGGNKTKAAQILGLTRNGLNLKLKRLGLS
jgi:DNA-binding NtrC family response regulator